MISASAKIHPSAIVEDGASIGDNVSVGPFCHIGSRVTLADNIEVMSHVSILGRTTIGAGTRIFPGAVLGAEPQNVHYKGEDTQLVIGSGCTIREGVTMNPGTAGDRQMTTVGNKCVYILGPLVLCYIAIPCNISQECKYH